MKICVPCSMISKVKIDKETATIGVCETCKSTRIVAEVVEND